MLVQMIHNRGVQYAYTKRSWSPLPCGVCGCALIPTMLYTLHLAPDPKRIDPKTGRRVMVPYAACASCAPFVKLEQFTGEMNLNAWMEAERIEASKPMDEQKTELQIPVVRGNTPKVRSRVQPRVFRKLVLQGPEATWIR